MSLLFVSAPLLPLLHVHSERSKEASCQLAIVVRGHCAHMIPCLPQHSRRLTSDDSSTAVKNLTVVQIIRACCWCFFQFFNFSSCMYHVALKSLKISIPSNFSSVCCLPCYSSLSLTATATEHWPTCSGQMHLHRRVFFLISNLTKALTSLPLQQRRAPSDFCLPNDVIFA